MEYAFRSAGKMNHRTAKLIKEVVEECEFCRLNERSRSRPVVAILRASDFNAVVTMALKEIGKVYILWMVCAFTKMTKAMVMKDKKAETILENLHNGWCLNFGFPLVSFYADNGEEFKNYRMEEFVKKTGIEN